MASAIVGVRVVPRTPATCVRCSAPGCGHTVEVLDSVASVYTDGETSELVVTVERVTRCQAPPNGCGTQRRQTETRRVRDGGETPKRYVRA